MPKRRASGIVALVSGGLDSLALTHRLLATGSTVCPVYVRGGLIWETAELVWLRRWLAALRHPRLKPLHVLDLPFRPLYGAHWSLTGRGIPSAMSADAAVYLPGRNVLLLGHAAIHAVQRGLSRLAMGILAGNPFGDASPAFFRQLAATLSRALSTTIRIETPLRRLSKATVIAAHRRQPLGLTFSCLQPSRDHRHCGRCNKCAERQRGFRLAGVPDPTEYAR